MRAGRASIVGLLTLTAWGCADGDRQSPTAPVQQPPPTTVVYEIQALSGSLEGTFDEAFLTFRGTARVDWRARDLRGNESWDFVQLMPLALTKEKDEWSGGDVWIGPHEPEVQPLEICAALAWAKTARDPGAALWFTQAGSSELAEMSIPGPPGSRVNNFVLGFSGTSSAMRISAKLDGSYEHFVTCAPL